MKIAVGLSGGVDSSVAAALLKEEGHDVIGITMRIWGGEPTGERTGHACYGPGEEQDIEDAKQVAAHLGIPFHVFDLAAEYEAIVLDYFRKEYIAGRTPNPCLRCNPMMKFGALVDAARASGLEFYKFATGHYARLEQDRTTGRHIIRKAKDGEKDQSYGLVFLSQEQLANILLPLGDMTKEQVRANAREFGLGTHDIPDSQDFYSGDHAELIGARPEPGPILDSAGNRLGTHDGIWHYTIGQRKGLGISAPEPVYVKEIDPSGNAVIVGTKPELCSSGLTASGMNWIAIEVLSEEKDVSVKIRHTPDEIPATVRPLDDGTVEVTFKEPQFAVAPGQIVGIYEGDVVLGGGVIERAKE